MPFLSKFFISYFLAYIFLLVFLVQLMYVLSLISRLQSACTCVTSLSWLNKPVINKLTRSSMIRKHSIKLYWCTLKSVVNITDACTVCVLGVLSRGLGNFGHALEDADSPAQQEVPESPGHGHAIYHQPPHGNKQEHIHSKIYPLQSIKYM